MLRYDPDQYTSARIEKLLYELQSLLAYRRMAAIRELRALNLDDANNHWVEPAEFAAFKQLVSDAVRNELGNSPVLSIIGVMGFRAFRTQRANARKALVLGREIGIFNAG